MRGKIRIGVKSGTTRLMRLLQKTIFDPIETNSMSVWGWLVLYAVIVLLRNFGDAIVWTHTIGHSIDPVHGQYFSMLKMFNAYALAHLDYALITCCILYFYTREDILKITKIVIVFWMASWVVPITDYIVTGGVGHALQYGTDVSGIIPTIIHAFNPFVRDLGDGRFSIGNRVEGFLLCLFSATYVWTKTKSFLKTVLVWLTHMFVFVTMMTFWTVVIVAPMYKIFPVFNRLVPAELASSPLLDKVLLTPGLIYTGEQMAGLSLMFSITFFLFLWFKIYTGENFKDFIKGLDWSRGLNYAGLTAAGIIFGSWRMHKVLPFAFQNPLDYYAAVLLPFAVFFLFQHTRIIKGIIENRPHKSVLWASRKEQFVIGGGFLFLSFLSAINISYWCTLYMLVFALIFYLIMLPPLKISKLPVISDVLLSLTSMFAFFTGFGLLADRESVHLLPAPLWRAGFFAFFLACSLRYIDKIGRWPVALMVLISFMVVPFFSYITPMYVPAALLGLLGVIAVLKLSKRLIPVISALFMAFYGIILFSIKRYVDIAL